MNHPRWRHVAVLALGAVLAWWVVAPGFDLSGRIVGDNGDAMWQLSVVRWTLDALWSFDLPWTPPMFFPTSGTYAYSDPMITQAVAVAPLRAIGGSPALLSNVLLLAAWTAGFYGAWRLLRRVGVHDAVALAGAAAWTYSELRIATTPLFQIATASALLPFVFERLLATLERPTIARGLVLGGLGSATTLGALYYGPLLAAVVPAVAAVWFLATRQPPSRRHVIAGVGAVAVVVLTVLPFALRYGDVHDRDGLERAPEVAFSARPADLAKVAPHHDLLAGLPGPTRADNGERALFPGLFVVLAVPALVFVRRAGRPTAGLVAVLVGGAVAYGLSTGWGLDAVPGFSTIRAPARFAVVGHLALVAAACWLLQPLLDRVRRPSALVVVTAGLVAVSFVGAGTWLLTATVPDRTGWTAVNAELDRLPPGPVVELPVMQPADGTAHARIEGPRLLLAGIDGNARVNGYSGFVPPGFADLAARLNGFPASDTVELLQALGVRYVVVRTDVVGDHPTGARGLLRTYGTNDLDRLRVSGAALAGIRRTLPLGVREVGQYGHAVLFDVCGADCRR